VRFYNPGLAAKALAISCEPQSMNYDPVRCGVPAQRTLALGGVDRSALLDRRPISASTFCDASDVSPEAPRAPPQPPAPLLRARLRYDTPIGPVRFDAGYRIPGAQVPRGTDLRVEGDPGTVYGAPIAFAFGIGEAF